MDDLYYLKVIMMAKIEHAAAIRLASSLVSEIDLCTQVGDAISYFIMVFIIAHCNGARSDQMPLRTSRLH